MDNSGPTMMSMYSELLAMSLDDVAGDPAVDPASSEKRLLDELSEQRRRLDADQAIAASRRPDASSRIATELQYDRALIRLCWLHAIPCDASRFTRPTRERRRLEEALEVVGVDVRGNRSHGHHRAAYGRGHEPPDGS